MTASLDIEEEISNICRQHVTQAPDAQKNFLVVDAKTEVSTIEQAFDNFTMKRKDIAILLINQHVRTYLLTGEEVRLADMEQRLRKRYEAE